MIGNSNDETNFTHKLSLTDTQVSKIRNAFENDSPAKKFFLKTQLSEMTQSEASFGDLIAAMSQVMFPSGQEKKDWKRYIISTKNELKKNNFNEIKDIVKVIKSLKNRGILLKGTARKITNHEREFSKFLRSFKTACLPLMKDVLTPLAKSVFLPIGVLAGMSAADAATQKKMYGSSRRLDLAPHIIAWIIWNEEIGDIMKTVTSTEKSGLLIKEISQKIKNEAAGEKDGSPPMILGILAASLLGTELAEKGVIRAAEWVKWVGEGL